MCENWRAHGRARPLTCPPCVGYVPRVCMQVTFNTDVHEGLPWSFKPVQKSVTVLAGQVGQKR